MGRSRLSLAAAMGAVGVLALALAVVRSGSNALFQAFFALTCLALLVAVIGARYRPERQGAFCFGSALFGWAALLFLFGWPLHWRAFAHQMAVYRFPDATPAEPLQHTLGALAARLHPIPSIEARMSLGEAYILQGKQAAASAAQMGVVLSGHLLLVWGVAAVGGLIGLAMAPGRAPGDLGLDAAGLSSEPPTA